MIFFLFSLLSYQSLEVQPYHPARLARLVGGNSTEITDELIDVAINMMRTSCIHEKALYICYYTPVQLEYFCSPTVEIDTEFHVQTIPVDVISKYSPSSRTLSYFILQLWNWKHSYLWLLDMSNSFRWSTKTTLNNVWNNTSEKCHLWTCYPTINRPNMWTDGNRICLYMSDF